MTSVQGEGAVVPRWLVLWDIDGTLVLRASLSHARAVWAALEEIHGVNGEGLKGSGAAGMTDSQISRAILTHAGIDADAIDLHARRVVERVEAIYDPEDLRTHVSPGIDGVLAELHARHDVVQSLVTGNYERVARRKLEAAGLGRWFDPRWGGGFGSDHEDRDRLPEIARTRAGEALGAGPWSRERTVIVGDTPRDIACARADGVHVVAVTTGSHGRDDLAGADAVVDDAAELREALNALVAATDPTSKDVL
ncbi:MAG: HAD family hydrolase [Solirubrobacteraceae bacterium]